MNPRLEELAAQLAETLSRQPGRVVSELASDENERHRATKKDAELSGESSPDPFSATLETEEERALAEALLDLSNVSHAFKKFRESWLLPDARNGDELAVLFRWGPLEVLEKIGEGSSAEVYLARDSALDRPLALKLYHRNAGVSQARQAAIQEGRSLASIHHVNVAAVYGVNEYDGRVGLWMEYVEGPSLRALVKNEGPMSFARSVSVGLSLARAVGAVHAQGLVHRDIKSDNVFLDPDDPDRFVLGDFGLTLVPDASPEGVVGTPLYMAPELMRGETANVATDLYAVGVLLFNIATGEFPVHAENLSALRERHILPGRVRWPSQHRHLPRRFRRLIERLLSPDAPRRFGSALELESALLTLRTPPKTRYISIATSTLFLSLIATALIFFPGSSNRAPIDPYLGPPIKFLAAPMVNATGDPALDSVQALIEIELAQSDELEMLGRRKVEEALARMTLPPDTEITPELAQELGWRLGVSQVLSVVLRSTAERYILTATIDDVAKYPDLTKPRLKSFRAENQDGLFDASDAASRWIRQTLGEPVESVIRRDLAVADTTTPSWRALGLFFLGTERVAERHFDEGVLLFEQAIELDPDFTMAYARAGDVLINSGQAEGYRYFEKAIETMTRRHLSPREELRVKALFAAENWQWQRAESRFLQYQSEYPRDYYPHFALAMVFREQGRYAAAMAEFKKAARLAPDSFHMPWQLAKTTLIMGEPELVAPYTHQLVEHGYWELAAILDGAAAMVRTDFAEARTTFELLKNTNRPEWRSRGFTVEAHWLGERGDLRAAQAVLEEGLTYVLSQDLPANHEAEKRLHLAFLDFAGDDLLSAKARAVAALDLDAGPRRIRVAGSLLARMGHRDEVEKLLARLEGEELPLFELVRATLRGELLLESGDIDESLKELEHAKSLEPPYAHYEYLGRAYVKAGLWQDALAVYERIALMPGGIWREEPGRLLVYPGYWSDGVQRYIELAKRLGLDEKVELGRNVQANWGFVSTGRERSALSVP